MESNNKKNLAIKEIYNQEKLEYLLERLCRALEESNK